ncbi:MAG: hypothetical protein E4H03_11935 [Myxococcales bacterium]|nr:MAG: hypothetical protein E4H03_11935 [Myxococcales bacterium]
MDSSNQVDLSRARRLTEHGHMSAEGKLPPPELALMRAVLEDGVMCYLGRARRRRIDPRILRREAAHWIQVHDWESPFSFNNVCEALGLDHESTRTRILAWPPAAPFSVTPSF